MRFHTADRPRERFRAILLGDRCIHPASVFDPLSARIAEDVGFEVAMLSGAVASLVVLGSPDLVLMTMSELVEQARRIARASALPLLVDADHGFGNALNVMRTVHELETAGVSALTIEDTVLPKQYGIASTQLVSLTEAVDKLRAAMRARRDPHLVVIARTHVPAMTDRAELLSRARAYDEAGVDALFLAGISTQDQLLAVRSATALPLILSPAPAELRDPAFLSASNVKIALQGHQAILASVEAVRRALGAVRNGAPPDDLPNLASPAVMDALSRSAEFEEYVTTFMAG